MLSSLYLTMFAALTAIASASKMKLEGHTDHLRPGYYNVTLKDSTTKQEFNDHLRWVNELIKENTLLEDNPNRHPIIDMAFPDYARPFLEDKSVAGNTSYDAKFPPVIFDKVEKIPQVCLLSGDTA